VGNRALRSKLTNEGAEVLFELLMTLRSLDLNIGTIRAETHTGKIVHLNAVKQVTIMHDSMFGQEEA
jgi:hypothetical protein